jgi:YegS/Rv2252/BmrU family lipid kinase
LQPQPPSTERLVFLVNPASANGSTGRRWPDLEKRAGDLGLTGRSVLSRGPGELGELAARSVAEGAGLLVVVGGDGTVHEVVDGLMKAGRAAEVELAVLPRGTGKDFVRSLRIPRSFGDAIELARSGAAREIDVGRATYRAPDGTDAEAFFANFGGVGISGAIADRSNRTSKELGGRLSFIWATLTVFARWRSAAMTLDVDGERRSGQMFEAVAMNGDYTAGGMWMAPEASPDDGLLDFVTIGDVTKLDFVTTFPKIYRGTHLSHPKIDLLRGRRLSVDADTPLPVVLDGEQPGTTPVTFEIVPKALRVRAPAPD